MQRFRESEFGVLLEGGFVDVYLIGLAVIPMAVTGAPFWACWGIGFVALFAGRTFREVARWREVKRVEREENDKTDA